MKDMTDIVFSFKISVVLLLDCIKFSQHLEKFFSSSSNSVSIDITDSSTGKTLSKCLFDLFIDVHVNSLLLSKFYKFKFQDENLILNRLSKSCVLELLRMHHVTLIFPQLITTPGPNFIVKPLKVKIKNQPGRARF